MSRHNSSASCTSQKKRNGTSAYIRHAAVSHTDASMAFSVLITVCDLFAPSMRIDVALHLQHDTCLTCNLIFKLKDAASYKKNTLSIMEKRFTLLNLKAMCMTISRFFAECFLLI